MSQKPYESPLLSRKGSDGARGVQYAAPPLRTFVVWSLSTADKDSSSAKDSSIDSDKVRGG